MGPALLEEQDGDVLREGIRVLSQALMETEVAGLIGAERYERTRRADGLPQRESVCGPGIRGWARSSWPSLIRPGTYFPSLLEPRRRAEHALLAVVQEALVHAVSTRKVDDLMRALGLEGISKSEVSRICGELDTAVAAFRTRRAHRRASVLLGRCDVPQGARRRPRAQPGNGGRGRRHDQRRSPGARPSTSARPRIAPSGRRFFAAW